MTKGTDRERLGARASVFRLVILADSAGLAIALILGAFAVSKRSWLFGAVMLVVAGVAALALSGAIWHYRNRRSGLAARALPGEPPAT